MNPIVKLTPSNTRIGIVASVGLVPVNDCGNCGWCKKECYILEYFKKMKRVNEYWKNNSMVFRGSKRDAIVNSLISTLNEKRPKQFIINISGDFLSQEHVDIWREVTKAVSETRFVAFTKMHHFNYSRRPKNFKIIFSVWPGMPKPKRKKGIQFAWLQDSSEDRIPSDAIECPGLCYGCGMCWSLDEIKKDVVFSKR